MNSQQHFRKCTLVITLLMIVGLLVKAVGCTVYPLRPRKTVRAGGLVYVQKSPPTPIVENPPPRPSPKAVWIGGHWRWAGRKYVWVKGRWDRNPRGAWISGRWERRPRGWVWVTGRWR